MEDSHFSDPESQMVAETKAEGLMVRDLEQILEETPGIRAKIAPVFRPDLPGAKPLSAAGPPIILGGTLSGHPFFNVKLMVLYTHKNLILSIRGQGRQQQQQQHWQQQQHKQHKNQWKKHH